MAWRITPKSGARTPGSSIVPRRYATWRRRATRCSSGRADSASRYVVEVKTAVNFAREDSYRQLVGYIDTLKLDEGWMPVFDEDKSKPWEEKLFTRDETETCDGKTIHVVGL